MGGTDSRRDQIRSSEIGKTMEEMVSWAKLLMFLFKFDEIGHLFYQFEIKYVLALRNSVDFSIQYMIELICTASAPQLYRVKKAIEHNVKVVLGTSNISLEQFNAEEIRELKQFDDTLSNIYDCANDGLNEQTVRIHLNFALIESLCVEF